MRAPRPAPLPALAALAAIVAGGLLVRLRHNDYGLPYVYNIDEGSHFTNRAVEMFGGDLNPGYFQNPSGFTYLLHLALRVRFGSGWPFGDPAKVPEQFRLDPTPIYELGRGLAAVLCVLGVVAVFWVGNRLWGALEGVAAAGVLSFAFLPVVYSRIAVTDTGTLAPVALAVYGAVRVHERGHARDHLLAGTAAGVAIGFKYTAGLVLLPLLVAAGGRVRREPRTLVLLGLGLLAGALALLVTTPYLVLDLGTAVRQLGAQAETASDFRKLGQAGESGPLYYLDSLTWGLGWAAAAAALGGLAVEVRRDALRALVLVVFPVALFVYLSLQARYFGRWLLPAYPVLALLAGSGLGLVARRLALVRPLPSGWAGPAGAAVLAGLLLVVLAQPVAADVRTAAVLGRQDTRERARHFLVTEFRPRLRVVIEPAVPARYYRLTRPGEVYPPSRKQFVRGFSRDVRETRLDYGATLDPDRIDLYRRTGYCLVMTTSVIRGRAENDGTPAALAYYRRLERESDLIYATDPYDRGAGPVPFHFDLSYNYYAPAYFRPGPAVRIYRLRDCRQGYGALPPGAGRPEVAEGAPDAAGRPGGAG